jgi:hypothetical protein
MDNGVRLDCLNPFGRIVDDGGTEAATLRKLPSAQKIRLKLANILGIKP